jgi:hypothetical protein
MSVTRRANSLQDEDAVLRFSLFHRAGVRSHFPLQNSFHIMQALNYTRAVIFPVLPALQALAFFVQPVDRGIPDATLPNPLAFDYRHLSRFPRHCRAGAG